MLLRQLEYVAALAREQHFGRAAQVCHVSQPALSAGIRKLEAELGVQIVRRGQRFDGFTPEGELVLAWGQRVLADRTALDQELDAMKSGVTGRLRIGAIPTAMTLTTLLTEPMHEAHPAVTFALESLTSREIVRRLNEFDLDIGITYLDGEPLGRVRTVTLYRERYLFLTPADREDSGPSWAEAAAAPLVLLTPDMQNRRILDSIFTEAGAQARPVVETDTISEIYAHAASMRLSSVIPHAWVHRYGVPEGMRVHRLPASDLARHVGLILAGSGPVPLLAQTLVGVARELDIAGQLDAAVAAV